MINQRRNFIKGAACSVLSWPLLANVFDNFAWAQELKHVPAEDPIAKALGYVPDATKVNTTQFPKRSGPEGAKQFCSNCVLLTQTGLAIPGVEGTFGKCSVLQGGLVNVKGWCNSWALKPGA